MNIGEAGTEIPTLDDLRKKLAALNNEIGNLTGSQFNRVTAQMRDRPLSVILAVLGMGLIGGYLLKR